ncbi:MAG: hypothetical protein HSCHL_2514 [Hydrogenibacillus schlegelii]|uniref:Uncharacterized protein n=1 Tax=Hydrogenibacillus schlegelii TaxID=1484 RepID=A0A2T5G9L4_HYDSH|nr:MAG: hypothetical protein HSCHL_2514 [Hydrogenibacillus schlegelii]
MNSFFLQENTARPGDRTASHLASERLLKRSAIKTGGCGSVEKPDARSG